MPVDSFRNCWWRKCGASRRRRWKLSWSVFCFFVTLFLIGVWHGRTSEVKGFWQLSHALRARQPRLSVFYPSSVAVRERPQGKTEYAMAKAAGEVLCADMNLSLASMHVTVRRLPRLPTDQTASVVPVEAALPVDVMLPIIREVQSWPR